MFYALQHFLEEVRVLVKLDGTKGNDDVDRKKASVDESNQSTLPNQSHPPTLSNQSGPAKSSVDPLSSTPKSIQTVKSKPCYSREDLCEVEPTIVTCLLRLCVRYVAEIEAVDRSGNTSYQRIQ